MKTLIFFFSRLGASQRLDLHKILCSHPWAGIVTNDMGSGFRHRAGDRQQSTVFVLDECRGEREGLGHLTGWPILTVQCRAVRLGEGVVALEMRPSIARSAGNGSSERLMARVPPAPIREGVWVRGDACDCIRLWTGICRSWVRLLPGPTAVTPHDLSALSATQSGMTSHSQPGKTRCSCSTRATPVKHEKRKDVQPPGLRLLGGGAEGKMMEKHLIIAAPQ